MVLPLDYDQIECKFSGELNYKNNFVSGSSADS